MSLLTANHLVLRYGSRGRPVVDDLTLHLEEGKVYSVIGPNGCGKSTLLRAIGNQLEPASGNVLFMDRPLKSMSLKQIARQLSFIAQSHPTVEITVDQLVSYGRSPHYSFLQRASDEDERVIRWALEATSLEHLKDRPLESLSGGERQRAWIAMGLVQQPALLLLDEPTTYLDVSHQMEVLELVRSLNNSYGMTVVMVLHDLNHAAQFSDKIIVVCDGAIYAQGSPFEVMTPEMLLDVFSVRATISVDEETGSPVCQIRGKA